MPKIQFFREKKNQKIYQKFLEEWFYEIVKALEKENLKKPNLLKAQEVSLAFVSKVKIKKMNKDYRGLNKATDVLSFSGDGIISLGDLVFCLDKIKDKSKNSDLSLKHYLAFLLTHSSLHLLGYEHEASRRLEKEMFLLQNKVVQKVAKKLAPGYKKSFTVEI